MSIKLINRCCLEEMKQIETASINLVLTDLPYGTTNCKWDSIIDLDLMWEQVERVVVNNGAILFTASQPFTTKLISSNYKLFRYEWIWKKNRGANFASQGYQPSKEHESVLVFYKKKPTYNAIRILRSEKSIKRAPVGTAFTKTTRNLLTAEVTGLKRSFPKEQPADGTRGPSSVISFDLDQEYNVNYRHPTKKPIKLMEYMIKTYTNEGDKVLDFTMGSGTTGVACKNLSRNFIGIEKDEHYFNVTKERIKNAQTQVTMFD